MIFIFGSVIWSIHFRWDEWLIGSWSVARATRSGGCCRQSTFRSRVQSETGTRSISFRCVHHMNSLFCLTDVALDSTPHNYTLKTVVTGLTVRVDFMHHCTHWANVIYVSGFVPALHGLLLFYYSMYPFLFLSDILFLTCDYPLLYSLWNIYELTFSSLPWL